MIARTRAALAAAAFAFTLPALAVDNVKMLIPANPGGGWDTTGREFAKAMQSVGAVKNVQYDNKGGAAGAIGIAQFVNSSKGDPNAVMMGGLVMVGGLITNKSAVQLNQVTPLARLTSEWEVIVVPASGPKTLKELLDKFKANPGSVSWGGGSAGGTDHILAGLIAKAIGADPTKVNYVPFKGGGEAVSAIIGGHVTAGVSGLSEFAQHIKSGKMRALAVSSPKALDGIPSLKEQGVDVELANWRGIWGAPGITKAQRDELIAAVEKGVKSPAWKESLKKNEWEDFYQPGDAFGKFIDDENKRIADILAALGLGKK
ncbi:C4-dicarboxylate ABC transporter substrate-binding protein [Betaproteobacteria bacterium GR16-43]|nr:C4-dicarboxylate ABC transporter substrate-binding protein [Betaproteobacteria bacterium GR16-43]